jgi:hypothetical protein
MRWCAFLIPFLYLSHLLFAETTSAARATNIPVVFEDNYGQAPGSYRLISRHGAVQALYDISGVDLSIPGKKAGRGNIRFSLIGARAEVAPHGSGVQGSVSNYLIGSDSSRWLRQIPNYSGVEYSAVYPGIDLIFHGAGTRLEHDFRISSGANPSRIRFALSGAQQIRLTGSGDLEVLLPEGSIVFRRPVAYQQIGGKRKEIKADFILEQDQSVGFQVGAYDHKRELVIDPVFSFSTYLAGNTGDNLTAVTTDANGNVFVAGYTFSSEFPTQNPIQATLPGSPGAFISKLDPTGQTLLYSTYFGGSFRNYANAIAIDSKGNVIVAGTSSSNDFPHAGSVPVLTCQGNNDCFFIASLKADGSAFNYAGLIGGIEGTDVQTGQSGSGVLALDASDNAYLASVTDDESFQITSGTLSTSVPGYPYNSTFVLKVAPTGKFVYSTIIPGTEPPTSIPYTNVFVPNGIRVDANGQAAIAGTAGPGLPTTAGVVRSTFPNDLNNGSSTAGFVLQLNATASAIKYATYVPGTDSIGGMVVDKSSNVYVTGSTSETTLPVSTTAYQKTIKPGQFCTCNSGFLVKLNSSGTKILAATYLEGTPADSNVGTSLTGMAIDSHSNVYVGGMTGSQDFPLVNPFVSQWVFGSFVADMVLARMSPDLSFLTFGSFLSSTDQIFAASEFSAITVDASDNLVVVGQTATTDFPTTADSFQPAPPNQARHGFVAKLNMAVAAPSVCLDTWGLQLGQVQAQTSSASTLHLTNCGNAALNLASVTSSLASVKVTQFCGAIQPGTVCPLSVTFSPVDSSSVNGTITLKDNAVIATQVVNFSGQGVAGQLSPAAGSFDFGHLLVNTLGGPNSLFFSNAGNAPLTVNSASVNGDFLVNQNSCIGTLAPQDFCVIALKFAPKAAGIRTGVLTIVSNDPEHAKAGLSLKGIGDSVYAVPLIASLSSPTARIKNGAVTITVYGANFYPASVVAVNGTAQSTKYMNGQQIQATLQSAFTNTIGEVSITVVNPSPGGGMSIAVPLTRYRMLNLNPAFITTVPGSNYIYAAIGQSAIIGPNTVVSIDPLTGTKGTAVAVATDPRLLAASSDGAYLYVVAQQDQRLQRINLSTKKVDRTFAFPPSPNCPGCGPQSAMDLKSVPGDPQKVVLALTDVIALYNDSGLVNYVPSSSIVFAPTFSSFDFAGSPAKIYSLPFTSTFFNIFSISDNGLQFTPVQNNAGNNTTGAQVVSDGNLLYTSAGEIWNPSTKSRTATFPVTTFNKTASLVVDSPSNHMYVIGNQLYQTSAAVVLSAYSRSSHKLSGALGFPALFDPFANNLIRWGSNGFAFLSDDPTFTTRVLYVLTSSLADTVASNPVPQLKDLSPATVSKGSAGFQLTVNGSNFIQGSSVKWNGVSLSTTFVASTVLTATVPSARVANSGTAVVTVTSPTPGGGTSNTINFSIASLAPLVSFSSASIAFPDLVLGSSNTRTISMQNPGTGTLIITSIAITGASSAAFHQSNTCGGSLPPGANCAISVTFKPGTTGASQAAVSVTDNATGTPQKVSLIGAAH